MLTRTRLPWSANFTVLVVQRVFQENVLPFTSKILNKSVYERGVLLLGAAAVVCF